MRERALVGKHELRPGVVGILWVELHGQFYRRPVPVVHLETKARIGSVASSDLFRAAARRDDHLTAWSEYADRVAVGAGRGTGAEMIIYRDR